MSFLAVISYTLLMRLHSVMHVVLLYHLKMSQVLQRLHMLRCGRPQLSMPARWAQVLDGTESFSSIARRLLDDLPLIANLTTRGTAF